MDVSYIDTFDEDPIYINYEIAEAIAKPHTQSKIADTRQVEGSQTPWLNRQSVSSIYGVYPQQRFVNQNPTLESVTKMLNERIRPIKREAPNRPTKKIARLDKPIDSICFATLQDYLDYKSTYG